MIKRFKYTTNLEKTYGAYQLGLKEGEIFTLIESKLDSIKHNEGVSVYEYEYLISIKNRCYFLDGDSWWELISYSEFIGCG